EYLVGVYEVLRGWGERIQVKDVDDLRDELLVKQRGDNRVHLCLKWLEVLGVSSGSFESHDLELVAPFDPSVLPDFVGTQDKLRADLEGLLSLWRFVGDGTRCRRVALAAHFGFGESDPQPPACGACDVCAPPEGWLAERHTPRPRRGATDAGGPEPEAGGFKAGDWVRVDGRHLGRVVGLTGRGARAKLLVESIGDMRRRTVDPRRKRVERVEDA
ncbi:MAG: RecQ family zinc-binding domain-containing protein, partial [Planctomycetota bacterium]